MNIIVIICLLLALVAFGLWLVSQNSDSGKKLEEDLEIAEQELLDTFGAHPKINQPKYSEPQLNALAVEYMVVQNCIRQAKLSMEARKREIERQAEEIELWFENHGQNGEFDMLAEGKYPVTLETVGRSKKAESLVNRKYIGRDGVEKTKLSITFNPFLKTKLIGVLATSFLRGGGIIVDGVKMGKERLIEYAIQNGFDIKEAKKTIKTSAAIEDESELDVKELAVEYLRSNGFDVEIVRTKYGKYYYDYRNRLNNSPHHKEKSKKHIHNMALRFMIKRFLVDLYVAGRTAEGLPVAEEYGVAKLGLIHGQACAAKERKQA